MKNWKTIATLIIFISALLLIAGVAMPKPQNSRTRVFVENPRLSTVNPAELPIFQEKFTELNTEIVLPAPNQSSRVLLGGEKFQASYRGWLAATGEIFDQAVSLDGINGVVEFDPKNLIPGFRDGVIGMQLGEIRRIFVPAELGYGNEELEGIPADSDIIFDVELIWF